MINIRAELGINAPIEVVFDILTDHTGYVRFPGIAKATLLCEGSPEANGLGAERELIVGGVTYREEILAFERPTRMDYRVRYCSFPLRHDHGRIDLEEVEGGTRVVWESRAACKLPIIGRFIDRRIEPKAARQFGRMLRAVKELAEAGGEGSP